MTNCLMIIIDCHKTILYIDGSEMANFRERRMGGMLSELVLGAADGP